MVTVQSNLQKSKGWNPAVSLPELEKYFAGAFQSKALFLKSCSTGARRHLDLGLGMAVACTYYSDFSHLTIKRQQY